MTTVHCTPCVQRLTRKKSQFIFVLKRIYKDRIGSRLVIHRWSLSINVTNFISELFSSLKANNLNFVKQDKI